MAAWNRKTLKYHFGAFFGKTTPYVKIFKILLQKDTSPHKIDVLCSNFVKFGPWEMGESVRCVHDKNFAWLSSSRY